MIKRIDILVLVGLGLILNNNCKAIARYSSSNVVQIETEKYKVFHYHDFTSRRYNERLNVRRYGLNSIFIDSLNSYSFISVVDKKTGKTVFKKACPALDRIVVSKSEKYIMGLSNSKHLNPFELVVFDINGNLLFKKSFDNLESKLTEKELKKFACLYPKHFQRIIENNSIVRARTGWYISLGTYLKSDSNYHNFVIKAGFQNNHSFPNFSGDWYNRKELKVKFIEDVTGNLSKIIINDNKGVDRTIVLKNESFTMDYFIEHGIISKKNTEKIPTKNSVNISIPRSNSWSYLQMGTLYDYYTTLEGFLKQDSLQLIHSYTDGIEAAVSSYNLIVFCANNKSKSFSIEGGSISSKEKEEISKLKKVIYVFIEDVKVKFIENDEGSIRRLAGIRYSIID